MVYFTFSKVNHTFAVHPLFNTASMLTRYLFPHHFKRIGWVLASIGLILGLLELYDLVHLPHLLTWLPSPIGNTDLPDIQAGHQVRANHDLYAVMLICGGILVACSRQAQEDEYIGQVRLESLLWALYLYYALLLLCFLLISGTAFLLVMMYALFAPLLLFLVRFHWVLYRSANAAIHAE
jgi:hypothetical protein